MAAKKLASTVHVLNEETGQHEVFLAGSTPPAWARKAITNKKAWASETEAQAETEDSGGEGGEQPPAKPPGEGPPPKGGAGSNRDAWAAFAASKGVEFQNDANRDDIIAALEAKQIPTE